MGVAKQEGQAWKWRSLPQVTVRMLAMCTKTSNCSFLLQEDGNLRPLSYKDSLPGPRHVDVDSLWFASSSRQRSPRVEHCQSECGPWGRGPLPQLRSGFPLCWPTSSTYICSLLLEVTSHCLFTNWLSTYQHMKQQLKGSMVIIYEV